MFDYFWLKDYRGLRMICKKCRSSEIKSRTNYTHGKKSKANTSMTCKKCGSSEIETSSQNRNYRNKNGRR